MKINASLKIIMMQVCCLKQDLLGRPWTLSLLHHNKIVFKKNYTYIWAFLFRDNFITCFLHNIINYFLHGSELNKIFFFCIYLYLIMKNILGINNANLNYKLENWCTLLAKLLQWLSIKWDYLDNNLYGIWVLL